MDIKMQDIKILCDLYNKLFDEKTAAILIGNLFKHIK
jgi:hypothetical protein